MTKTECLISIDRVQWFWNIRCNCLPSVRYLYTVVFVKASPITFRMAAPMSLRLCRKDRKCSASFIARLNVSRYAVKNKFHWALHNLPTPSNTIMNCACTKLTFCEHTCSFGVVIHYIISHNQKFGTVSQFSITIND